MRRNKTYLDVEISRERRLWAKEVRSTLCPLILAGSIIFSDKENRESVKRVFKKAKDKVSDIFK